MPKIESNMEGPAPPNSIIIPECGDTTTNPQKNHQLPIINTQPNYPLPGIHHRQGSPKKISPTPKNSIRQTSQIRVIFDNKNVQNYHKNYPNWRVMVNYHISRVMENG